MMKMVREEVVTLVQFEKSSANPIAVTYSGGSLRIAKIVKSWKERRNLKDCHIYICQISGRDIPFELRWELESNRWFLDKL